MDNLDWTTDVPVTPGYYWAYEALDPEDADIFLVRVSEQLCDFSENWYSPPPERKMRHICFLTGNEHFSSTDDFSHWIGPLEMPDYPK